MQSQHSTAQSREVKPATCRGVVLLNGAGRIEDVQTAVEAPVSAALSDTEKDLLSAIDPEDFSSSGRSESASNASTSSSQPSASQSPSSQKAAPLTNSGKEQASFMSQVLAPLATIAKRVAVYGSFIVTKQPARVKSVLQQVSFSYTFRASQCFCMPLWTRDLPESRSCQGHCLSSVCTCV